MKHAKKSALQTVLTKLGLCIGVLAALILLLVWLLPGRYDKNAITGTAGNDAQRMEEMEKALDRSMITMCINANPVWKLSDREAGVNWQIENPKEQATKLIKVIVTRDDNGDKIYQTGSLLPGTYITDTKPDVSLGEGTYSCTAYFYSYDIETGEALGVAGAQITLYVQP